MKSAAEEPGCVDGIREHVRILDHVRIPEHLRIVEHVRILERVLGGSALHAKVAAHRKLCWTHHEFDGIGR